MNVEIYTFSDKEDKCRGLTQRTGDELYTIKEQFALNVCETMCSQGQSSMHLEDQFVFTHP